MTEQEEQEVVEYFMEEERVDGEVESSIIILDSHVNEWVIRFDTGLFVGNKGIPVEFYKQARKFSSPSQVLDALKNMQEQLGNPDEVPFAPYKMKYIGIECDRDVIQRELDYQEEMNAVRKKYGKDEIEF